MKFISKSSNLLVVLRPGLPAQPLTGTPQRPAVSVRFKDGIVDVQQQEFIDMMLQHPGFNSDFISAEAGKPDPYAGSRRSSEPAHSLTEMKYGTPVARQIVGGDTAFSSLPREMQDTIKSLATEMAKAMIPSMIESTLKSIVGAREASKASASQSSAPLTKAAKPKGRPGRKPKAQTPELTPHTESPIAENATAQTATS